VAGACELGNEPSGSIKCGELTSCKPVSFSRRTMLYGVSKWFYSFFARREIERAMGRTFCKYSLLLRLSV
jgi:hypothetical protein